MHLYVFWRVIGLSVVNSSRRRNLVLGVFGLLWLTFLVGLFYGHDGSGFLAAPLEMFNLQVFGLLFIVSLPLLLVDLVTGFGFLFREYKSRLRSVALALGLLLTLFALFQGMRAPVMQYHTVYLSNLPQELDKTTLVAISDTHIGSILGADWLDDRVTQVMKQKPDLIFILGDFLEGHGTQYTGDLLPILKRLETPLGIWAVPGNHDSYGSDNQSLKLLEKAGVRVLRYQSVQIQDGFNLIGFDDDGWGDQSDETAESKTAAANRHSDFMAKTFARLPDGVTIVISHEPKTVLEAEKAGVDLMLSAHTHGGQIWPFDYLVQSRYPYLEGRYEFEKMSLIVTRGAGTWGPLMRLWQPGEILHITLRKGE